MYECTYARMYMSMTPHKVMNTQFLNENACQKLRCACGKRTKHLGVLLGVLYSETTYILLIH